MPATYTLHPWHSIHSGEGAPHQVNALIEISKGSRCKYEIDKTSGLLKLDRIIHSSFHYPVNYGFIPQTIGDDGDALDILVICCESIQPLCLTAAKVIGNMQMIDSGKMDDKIIAVAAGDPEYNHIDRIENLPTHFLDMLRNFFEQYKVLEKKQVEINSFQPKEEAYAIINNAMQQYQSKVQSL